MKKTDLKKLALLGLAGGSILANQAQAQVFDASGYGNLLAMGCGGQHGCGGNSGSGVTNVPVASGNGNGGYYQQNPTPVQGGQQAPQGQTNPQGQPAPQAQPQNGQPVAYSCGGSSYGRGYSTPSSYYGNSSCNAQQPQQYYYGNQSSCGGKAQPQYYSNNQQPSQSSCGGQAPKAQYYTASQQPSHSCGGVATPQPQQQYYSIGQVPNKGCGAAKPAQLQAYNQPKASAGWNYSNTADNTSETPWEQANGTTTAPQKTTNGYQNNGNNFQNNGTTTQPYSQTPAGQVQTPVQPNQTGAARYQDGQRNFRNNIADAAPTAPRPTRGQLTESQLLSQLSPEGKATYERLDASGKALALKLVNMTCKGTNDCKGLNACKTATNSCAGNGGCKGTSPQAFQDINSAVKVAAKKMAEKRNGALR